MPASKKDRRPVAHCGRPSFFPPSQALRAKAELQRQIIPICHNGTQGE
jgi:hypothetical protein